MIFQRTKTPAPKPAATAAAAGPVLVATPASTNAVPQSDSPPTEADFGPLLDAFGQVLSAYTQSSFDLPGRTIADVMAELEPWRRHAMLGTPVRGDESGAIADRNFNGAARAFADSRRTEKRLVESALGDLREVLFTCVNRVHAAVQAGLEADAATVEQMRRVESAIQGLETGSVKDEVMQAIKSIEHISQQRRDQQQASFAAMADRVQSLGRELEEAKRDSETDALTGLGNRKRFEVAIERALQLHAISRAPLSLLMMDMDGLKTVNDTLGHSAGDAAITLFADTLAKTFIHDSDELCRIGGDEFVALLPGTRLDLAAKLANRLVDNVAALSADAGDGPRIGASVGYSEMKPGETVSAWMERTDAALYEAKRTGKGRAISA
ncbi:MAG: diguanylate cyclase domain-containing protein [Gemmatimonas sp.]